MTRTEQDRANYVANTVQVPRTSDKVTAELYGYVKLVLDEKVAARRMGAYWAAAYGVHTLTQEVADAMMEQMRYRAQ